MNLNNIIHKIKYCVKCVRWVQFFYVWILTSRKCFENKFLKNSTRACENKEENCYFIYMRNELSLFLPTANALRANKCRVVARASEEIVRRVTVTWVMSSFMLLLLLLFNINFNGNFFILFRHLRCLPEFIFFAFAWYIFSTSFYAKVDLLAMSAIL